MRYNIEEPRHSPCLCPAIAAVDAAEGTVVGAYTMGDTFTFLQFSAAADEAVLTVEIRPQNWREGGDIVARKLRNHCPSGVGA